MLKPLSKHKRKLKWILGVLMVLVVMIGAVAWYVSGKIKPFVQQELGAVVNKATNGLYHINFNKVSVNPLFGNASLTEVNLIADTNVYRKLVQEKKAPNNLYQIKLKKTEHQKIPSY